MASRIRRARGLLAEARELVGETRDAVGEALGPLPAAVRHSSDSLFFWGALVGVLLGGVTALLLVRRSGRGTRAELRAAASILLEPLRERIAFARAEAERSAAAAEQRVLERYDAIKSTR